MEVGRSAPRYQNIALIYSHSKVMQSNLFEYFIVVVRLCHQLLKYTQKSTLRQVASTLSDSDIKTFQSELNRWANSIREETTMLVAKKIEEEAQENSQSRALFRKHAKAASYQQRLITNLRVLDYCSKYDYETTWKQARKVGNTTRLGKIAEYQEWKNSSRPRTLFCTGKLGSGKSVLLANVVDDLNIHARSKDITVAYFFCRHDIAESLRARTVLGSLTRQLLCTIPDLATVAEVCNQVSSEDVEKVLRLLYRVFPPDHRVYFVLDGLDECDNLEREVLAQELQKLQSIFKMLLCISYRVEPGNGLELITQRFDALITSIPDDNLDIEAFVEVELERCLQCRKLIVRDPTIILEIQHALLKGAQGMFLWVALQIQSLCTMKTDQAIRTALKDLPKDLPETFSRILRKSKGLGQSYQIHILQLVTVAYRPLIADELREALSVVPGNTIWSPSGLLNNIYSALACCGCLLTVDEEESTVRFVHHSVKQFVLSMLGDSNNRAFPAEEGHRVMADIIATYLSYGVFGTELSRTKVPHVMIQSTPSNIIRATISPSNAVQNIAVKLLKSRKHTDFDISKILAGARKPIKSVLGEEFRFYTYAKLYWVKHIGSLLGQTPVISSLLPSILKGTTMGIHASNEDCWTLLWWAVQIGHKETVKLFLELGMIEKCLKNKVERLTLFLWAKDNSHNGIMELLEDKNAYTKTQDAEGSALYTASDGGNERIVKLLVDKGADVNAQGGEYGNALQAASWRSNERIVKLLVDKGADVNAQGGEYGNALQAASCEGNEQIVKLLVDKGADVNAQGGKYGNALQAASRQGNERIVKLLIRNGARKA